MTSSPTGELQTVIRNCGLLWASTHDRWMTFEEVLLSQGFPALPIPQMTKGSVPLCCSFQVERANTRKRHVCLEQAGNSMNIICLGYLFMWKFGCLDHAEESALALAGALRAAARKRPRLSDPAPA